MKKRQNKLPMKFNPGTKKYEPDLPLVKKGKFKQPNLMPLIGLFLICILIGGGAIAIMVYREGRINPNDFQITNFEQCIEAGNPAMESYPRQCRAKGKTFTEEIGKTYCEPEQRDSDACFFLWEPVCATMNVQCITTPCDPIQETYSNSCVACQDENVLYWEEGECPF